MSQYHINDNINSFNVNNSFVNVLNSYTVADEKSEILAWLSPLEPQRRHHGIRASRVNEVAGSYKRRNIGIGVVVFMGVNLMVQPCFAMEVRGLAKPILGKRKNTRGKDGIANRQ